MSINIYCNLENDVLIPEYQTGGSAGADVRASVREPITIKPGDRVLVPTGIFLEIPAGYEGQIRPRSGLAINHGITTLNSPGTIDSDYRGEVKVILINHGKNDFLINNGDRIAQMVFNKIERANFIKKEMLSISERNANGFGSTGI